MRLALPALLLAALPCGAADLAVRADRVHVGDGRVLTDAVVVVDDGRVAWIGRASAAPEGQGDLALRCTDLIPGLVAWQRPAEPEDAASADATRRGVDLLGPLRDDDMLARGTTAVAVSPGVHRLVAGRVGLVRLLGGGLRRTDVAEGPVQGSLVAEALDPPPIFEPVLRVNADNPLPAARLQRPFTAMGASAELRRLTAEPGLPWIDVRTGTTALALHARSEAEIRQALAVAKDAGATLIVTGGDEAWRAAADLAEARATVVLESPAPAQALRLRLDARSDAAALLHAAGVAVALAAPGDPERDPLELAARAVRDGMPHDAAIAAVTGVSARAAGREHALLEPGAPADLAGFDGDPLASAARPAFVVAGGTLLGAREAAPDDDERLLALRVGRALDPDRVVPDATILVRGSRIVSVLPSSATPSGAEILDLGPGSVAVPGFIDAFSRVGLDPGAPPGGSPRVRAQDALEPGHVTFRRALRAGVTAALAVPATRGSVLGAPAVIGLLARRSPPPHDADRPEPRQDEGREVVDVVATDAGLVAWIDDGPEDDAPRQGRLKALRETIQRAKAYHEAWLKAEKKPDPKSKTATEDATPEKPDKDPALEPWRAVLAGRSKAWLRCGREDLLLPALDAFKAAGVTPVVCGAEEAHLVASELATRGVTVVLAPGRAREIDGARLLPAAVLRAAGVPVAFGSFDPGAAATLPADVADMVREGLAAADALAGLTRTAAAASALPESAGRLAAGSRADVVVFEGDPMEPSSRILAVVARGRVARAPEPAP